MGRINGHKPTGRIMQNSYFSYFCSEITAEWLQSYFQYFSSQTTPKFELIFIQHTCREITRLSIYFTVQYAPPLQGLQPPYANTNERRILPRFPWTLGLNLDQTG
jgi:hypothetical protein